MGPDVHLRLTFDLAIAEGFTRAEAASIASADSDFDARFPARVTPGNLSRHFAPAAWWWSRRYLREACVALDLERLGWSLHCAQDAVAHGTLGEGHVFRGLRIRRHPDRWDAAPPGIRRRIEAVTRDRLRRYRAATGADRPDVV